MERTNTPQAPPDVPIRGSAANIGKLAADIRRLTSENALYKKRLAKLERDNASYIKRLAELEIENERLKNHLHRAMTTSRNSSKKPSSDIVKRRRNTTSTKRSIGGQPGHPKHERVPFAGNEIDNNICHILNMCPDCMGPVTLHIAKAPAVLQQVELVSKPVVVTEHKAAWYWCEKCHKLHCAMPSAVSKAGLCGPVLTAFIAYLKGGTHASYHTIRKYVRDVLGVTISRGMLRKVIGKVSEALEDPWRELQMLLPLEKIINVDETSHPENGRTLYTWCFRAREYILFKIAESRSTAELLEMLGADFDGVIGCDYFSSYRCYMRRFGGVMQFCLAHLIRDVKYVIGLPDAATRAYGQKYLDSLRAMFQVIHTRNEMTPNEFESELKAMRDNIIAAAVNNVPDSREAQNLANRMRNHGESYFRFITTPGLEPTNNLAEQAIRFVVIDRLITQGTRSESGRRWCERIWTILSTCEHNKRSAYHFIRDAVEAYFCGAPAHKLLPASP